jgi:hypothetical protein
MKHTYTLSEVLRFMGHLLETNPTTGVAARDKNGYEVDPESSHEACSFCLIGAKRAVLSLLIGEDYYNSTVCDAVDAWILNNLDCPERITLDAWEPSHLSRYDWPKVQHTTIERLKSA